MQLHLKSIENNKLFFIIFFFHFLFHIQAQNLQLDWAISEGGISFDMGTAIDTDTDGNVYIVGNYTDTVDFDPGTGSSQLTNHGISSMFIQKLDPEGNLIWVKSIGGIGSSSITGNSLHIDQNNDVYITGEFLETIDFNPNESVFNLTSVGWRDAFILKLANNGNFQWAHSYGDETDDNGWSITTDDSSNVYISGRFQGIVDFDSGNSTINQTSAGMDLFVLKLNTLGEYIWVKTVGKSGENGIILGYGVAIGSTGDVYVTGNFTHTIDFDPDSTVYNLSTYDTINNFGLQQDIFILKLNNNGEFLWVKSTTGSDVNSASKARNIKLDNQDNIFVNGYYSQTLDFDPSNNTYILTSTNSTSNFIWKLNSNGDFQWVKSYSIDNLDDVNTFDLDNNGNVYISATYQDIKDMDPNSTTFFLSSSGVEDFYLVKLHNNGNFISAISTEEAGYIAPSDIAIDNVGNIAITGFYTFICDFDPGLDTFNLTSNGNSDIFVVKLSPCTNPTSILATDSTLVSNNANALYQWLDCNNGYSPIPNETNQSFSPISDGIYAVKVTENGCTTISACIPFYFIGMDENILSNVTLHPNPAEESTLLYLYGNEPKFVNIRDISGLSIEQFWTSEEKVNIDLSTYSNGMYFIQLKLNNHSQVLKLVVNK